MEHLKLNLYFHDFSSFSGLFLISKLLVVFAVLIWVATWLWEPTNWEENWLLRWGMWSSEQLINCWVWPTSTWQVWTQCFSLNLPWGRGLASSSLKRPAYGARCFPCKTADHLYSVQSLSLPPTRNNWWPILVGTAGNFSWELKWFEGTGKYLLIEFWRMFYWLYMLHKIYYFNHFYVFNSVALSASMTSWDHHHYLIPEHSHLPKRKPITIRSHYSIFHPPNAWKPPVHFLSPWICCYLE